MRALLFCLTALAVAVSLFAPRGEGVVLAQSGAEEVRPEISGDPNKPRRHFRVRRAAVLGKEEANQVYRGLKDLLAKSYGESGDPVAEDYQNWQIYNDAPYRSSTHGQRYVNNFANDIAKAYSKYEKAGKLPPGSIVVKDSFSVTEDGDMRPGPFFIMRKMERGFNYVSGDWQYSMIMPGGEIFGVTKGVNSERVEYCIGCHLAQEANDHLYFLPKDYRLQLGE